MDIRDFLHFQGGFQSDGIIHSASQIQPVFDIPVVVGDPVNKTRTFVQNALDDSRQGLERFHVFIILFLGQIFNPIGINSTVHFNLPGYKLFRLNSGLKV